MDNILPFKIKYISVVASCDECQATWIAHIREIDFKKHLVDKRCKCCYCGASEVHYCRPC